MTLLHEETGVVYTDEDIERMRDELATASGLNLSDMSDRSVVANYLARGDE